jgi:hypothetical protein
MPLNTAGLTALLDLGAAAPLWFGIGNGPDAADQISDSRVRPSWTGPVDGVLTAIGQPLEFTGTNGGTASHLLVFSAAMVGTFYGSFELTGDLLFSADGRFHISGVTLSAEISPDVPAGFPEAANTGLAGVGMTEDDLDLYEGPEGFQGDTVVVIEDMLLNGDVRIYDSASVTLRRCKINGHIDIDSVNAELLMEDCHVDATTWPNAAVGFQNMTIRRCDIEGGITGVNASINVLVEDSYLHGQRISEDGPDHAGGFLCSGGHDITLTHNTIVCDVVDNGNGGGPSNNLNLFGDFSELLDITMTGNYFPVTGGGYSVSLGHNPGANFGDDPTNIVFTGNTLARDPETLKGGVFGTVTSFLAANGNVYSGNVWADDGTPVPVNE